MPKTVLIVEDNPSNMMLFNDLLEAHGYETLQAGDGGPVLALAREHRPDLILMDIQLPERSGLEITRSLKQDDQACAIPVVALTAYALKENERSSREAGCVDFMSKPITIAGFLDTVRRHIGPGKSGGSAEQTRAPR